MRLEALAGRAEAIGDRAAARVRDTILRDAALPGDVQISAGSSGIILSGRGLRRRIIDDAQLRNFARNRGIV